MKYCLLAFSRTGSTALEKCLIKHNDINHDMTRLPSVANKREWVSNFLKRKCDKKWDGFKCLLYQYDENLKEDILSNSNVTKIILLRRNIFESAISKKVAEKIGNWHRVIDYNQENKFHIEENWLISYVDFVQRNVNIWKSNSINYKIFYYEDIFYNKETYKPVLDFLKIEDETFDYTIEKVNNYDILKKIIINYESLQKIYEEKKCLI